MSTATIPLAQTILSANESADGRTPRWLLVAIGVVVGVAFFIAGHNLRTSLAEAYTQNAEDMEITAEGGNALRRVAFLVLGAGGALLLAASKQPRCIDPLLAGSLAVLLGLTGISFVWADDPGMCLRRLVTLVCSCVAAAGIARALTLRDINWLAVWVFGSLAVIGVLTEIGLGTFRPWASDYRFAGTVHPNTQGPALATLCLATFGLARERGRSRALLWCVFAIAFGLLLLTKSRTTTAAILVSLAAVQVIRSPLASKCAGIFAGGWLAVLALWLIWICGIDPLSDFRDAVLLGRAEESDTLSGRAFIWPEVVSFASDRFWLGYGYESFWTPGRIEAISDKLGWGLREAHNAYLEMWLSLGAIGVGLCLLVAGVALAAGVRGWRQTGRPVYALPIGLVVFGLINAGLESGMVAVSELVPFVLGCCLLRMALFRDLGGRNDDQS